MLAARNAVVEKRVMMFACDKEFTKDIRKFPGTYKLFYFECLPTYIHLSQRRCSKLDRSYDKEERLNSVFWRV